MGEIVKLNNDFAGLPTKYKYVGWLRLPEGQYQAVIETWVTFKFMSSHRLALIFNILDAGKHNGKHVPAFFGVKAHKGRMREKGRFVASPRGDLMDMYYRLNPSSPIIRPDRVPLSKLDGIYSISLKDVLKNRKQKEHPDQLIYSQVTEISNI